ncbi:MAG: purine-nucleoside phosphorylase [Eggerthellaceae bacterium]|nr:purine-nucleoside phosphorylase [Eggerthellaceae bacterium]
MEEMDLTSWLPESAKAVEVRLAGRAPELGIILGSGLGPLAESIGDSAQIPFADVPHMRTSTATSHVGRFVCGDLAGKQVICMQGRLHGYEGNTSQEIAYPVWLMHELGVRALIVTNAVGAINESYRPGDFCLMRDHINFTGRNPVAGLEPNKLADRFFTMYEAYDPEFREVARASALKLGIPLQEGVYLGLLGPSFETAAEIQAFARWGADTVAMSVCEEVIAARHVGMRVLGMSLVVNMACGVGGVNPLDDDPLKVAQSREADFCRLMERIVAEMTI